jgi:hypothetical protein
MTPCLQTVRLAVLMSLELAPIGHTPVLVDLVRSRRVARAWPGVPLLIRGLVRPTRWHLVEGLPQVERPGSSAHVALTD